MSKDKSAEVSLKCSEGKEGRKVSLDPETQTIYYEYNNATTKSVLVDFWFLKSWSSGILVDHPKTNSYCDGSARRCFECPYVFEATSFLKTAKCFEEALKLLGEQNDH